MLTMACREFNCSLFNVCVLIVVSHHSHDWAMPGIQVTFVCLCLELAFFPGSTWFTAWGVQGKKKHLAIHASKNHCGHVSISPLPKIISYRCDGRKSPELVVKGKAHKKGKIQSFSRTTEVDEDLKCKITTQKMLRVCFAVRLQKLHPAFHQHVEDKDPTGHFWAEFFLK